MAFLTSHVLFDILIMIITASYIRFKLYSKFFWKRRGIPYVEPTFILGNRNIFFPEPLSKLLERLYQQNRNEKILGLTLFTRPALLIIDIDLIKNILTKDFSYFHDRGLYVNEEEEPLTGNLFSLSGQKWRNLRVKLTPTFTSGKMKMMFDTMLDAGMQLQEYLRKPVEAGDVLRMKDLMSSYTTQVIGSCAFGINLNSIGNPNCPFQKYGKMIFQPSHTHFIQERILYFMPRFAKFLKFRSTPRPVAEFFMQTVTDVMEQREKRNIKRNDFIDLLLQLKNTGYIEDADTRYEEEKAKTVTEKFTVEQAAAQAFLFWIAGFETSSTTLMFTAYELAKNPDIQVKLHEEIDRTLQEEYGVVSYVMIQRMVYLDQVVQESLRKYAPLPSLFRKCTKRYQIPTTQLFIEEGDFMFLPIQAINSDPKYFPNPEIFDPSRYSKENCEIRDPFLNLSFGNGPRNCIGARFGLQQVKVGLICILSKYKLELAEQTPTQIVLDSKSIVPAPIGGIPLRITKR